MTIDLKEVKDVKFKPVKSGIRRYIKIYNTDVNLENVYLHFDTKDNIKVEENEVRPSSGINQF